ncbi:MAG: regulatory protein RecX, partial [Terriglobia bacterium]
LQPRPRSVYEMRTHLEKQGFTDAVIEKTVEGLQQNDLLNDRRFTESWVLDRQTRNSGPRKIAYELGAKGVDRELVQSVIEQLGDSHSVRELARQKLERLAEPDPKRAYRRLSQFLTRRGFEPDAVNETCRELLREKYGPEGLS